MNALIFLIEHGPSSKCACLSFLQCCSLQACSISSGAGVRPGWVVARCCVIPGLPRTLLMTAAKAARPQLQPIIDWCRLLPPTDQSLLKEPFSKSSLSQILIGNLQQKMDTVLNCTDDDWYYVDVSTLSPASQQLEEAGVSPKLQAEARASGRARASLNHLGSDQAAPASNSQAFQSQRIHHSVSWPGRHLGSTSNIQHLKQFKDHEKTSDLSQFSVNDNSTIVKTFCEKKVSQKHRLSWIVLWLSVFWQTQLQSVSQRLLHGDLERNPPLSFVPHPGREEGPGRWGCEPEFT